MKDDNWQDDFNLPKSPNKQSKPTVSSPTAKSCKSYALLNSPATSSQRRNFDKSERDKYFPIVSKVDRKLDCSLSTHAWNIFSADESFNLKKNLIASQLDCLTIDSPKSRTFGTSRYLYSFAVYFDCIIDSYNKLIYQGICLFVEIQTTIWTETPKKLNRSLQTLPIGAGGTLRRKRLANGFLEMAIWKAKLL